eukprot:PhM_4_TR3246/c0_g1_i1/m.56951
MSQSFRVTPSHSVGDFVLGMPLNDVVKYLRTHSSTYRRVNFEYEAETFCNDIIISLPWESLRLTFSNPKQRLKRIDVLNVDQVVLSYDGTAFSGPCTPAAFKKIYALLGPTTFGEYDDDTGLYTVSYDGCSVDCAVAPEIFDEATSNRKKQPFTHPNGSNILVRSLTVFRNGSSDDSCGGNDDDDDDDDSSSAKTNNNSVTGSVGDTSWRIGDGGIIYESDTPMDVVQEFGNPDDIAPSCAHSDVYAYQYHRLGLEVLFSATKHQVCAITLHTNLLHPTHGSDFVFHPCAFHIDLTTKVSITSTSNVGEDVVPLLSESPKLPSLVGESMVYMIGLLRVVTFSSGYIRSITIPI